MKASRKNKIDWVVKYMKEEQQYVDILNSDFVDAYINKFNPKHEIRPYCASKCNEISKILKMGYDNSIFERKIVGLINHMWDFSN